MPLVLSILGLSFVIVGTALLYMFHDPKFGYALMQGSHNPKRESRGARSGIALVALGTAAQIMAVIVAG